MELVELEDLVELGAFKTGGTSGTGGTTINSTTKCDFMVEPGGTGGTRSF